MIDEKKLIEELNKITFEADVHNNGYKGTRTEKMLRYEDVMSIINKQPKVGEWIPCSDRLPEDRKEKMVYLSSNRITIAKYNEHRIPHTSYPIGWGYIPKNGYIDFENETVIAWQPLSEPYQNDEQEE